MRLPKLHALLGGLVVAALTGSSALAQTELTPHPANPILEVGPPGSWDADNAFLPSVVLVNGVYHLFYYGNTTGGEAIGLATSTDGIHFTRCSANPILEGDGTGFDAWSVVVPLALFEQGEWVLYYSGRDAPGSGPGTAVGRATATNPCGPWQRLEDPVLEAGPAGEWDSGYIAPTSIVVSEGRYFLYFSAGVEVDTSRRAGLATSLDGLTWRKWDDPATTASPYALCDPVLPLGDPGAWDSAAAWTPTVLKTACRWEMYYSGWTGPPDVGKIGYALSEDGVHWLKSNANPIFTASEPWASWQVWPHSAMTVGSTYRLHYSGIPLSNNRYQAGLATAPMEPDVNGNGIPDECECLADVNGDGTVDVLDLLELLAAWGPCPECPSDVNFDGVVDVLDLLEVLANWGPCEG